MLLSLRGHMIVLVVCMVHGQKIVDNIEQSLKLRNIG